MNKAYTTQTRLPDGANRYLGALAGRRLMEVLRDYGVPIKAESGGACDCATCHIYVHKEGQTGLPAPDDKELMLLDELFDADGGSRLSCQILTGPQTDGLVISLAPAVMEVLPLPFLKLKTGESTPEADILQSLSDSDVVAVYFEKSSDGWGFSLGRQLRGSLSCDHPFVANGHIIPDQAEYLRWVGFSHAMIVPEALPQWQKSLVAVTHRFQALYTSPRTRNRPKR